MDTRGVPVWRAPVNLTNRFLNLVDEHEAYDGCWWWGGAVSSAGYGSFRIGARVVSAHRVAYALFVGPLKKGKVVMHLCHHKLCVNPDHLQLGTQLENMQAHALTLHES